MGLWSKIEDAVGGWLREQPSGIGDLTEAEIFLLNEADDAQDWEITGATMTGVHFEVNAAAGEAEICEAETDDGWTMTISGMSYEAGNSALLSNLLHS